MEGFLAPGLTSAFSATGKLLLSSVSLESIPPVKTSEPNRRKLKVLQHTLNRRCSSSQHHFYSSLNLKQGGIKAKLLISLH